MLRVLVRSLTTVLGLALVSSLVSSPAHAATKRIPDARGDVVTTTIDFDAPEDEMPVLAPSVVANGDVLWTQLRHSRQRIELTVRYAELRRTNELSSWSFQLRGSNGQRRDLELMAGQLAPRGETELTRPGGRTVCPRAVRHRLDYGTKTVTVSMPRRCVGSPQSVQVRGLGLWMRGLFEDTSTVEVFLDDLTRTGGTVASLGTRWSPKVRRG